MKSGRTIKAADDIGTAPVSFSCILDVLSFHERFTNGHLKDACEVLAVPTILDLCAEHRRQESDPDRLHFNLFHLISNTYHKENFHSDILAALLDPDGRHGAGHAFLHIFIDWLSRIRKLDGLDAKNFSDSIIHRESGRIDISVLDRKSQKAIIIENKITGATDQPRQLPRYLDHIEGLNFEPVAVVYLTLNSPKKPYEDSKWRQPDDHQRVHKILISATAFNYNLPCLKDHFLRECELRPLTSDQDALFVLRQYGSLIHHMGKNTMNETLMSKFYEQMITNNGETFRNARAFVEMMGDLPRFRANQIINKFERAHKPFDYLTLVDKYPPNISACFHFDEWVGVILEVWCERDQYRVLFWDRDNPKGNRQRTEQIMDQSSMRLQFSMEYVNDRVTYVRNYKFPMEEAALYSDLETFLRELETFNCIG